MVPIVKTSASYIKDRQHALEIFRSFNFLGENKLLFTVDMTSLFTVISNNEGLRALKNFFDQRTDKEPSSETLLCQTEPVLTLNFFPFRGNHYKQTNGVAMGPSHVNSVLSCTPIFQSIQQPQAWTLQSPHWRLYRRYLLYQRGAHSIYNRRRFLSSNSEIYLGNFRLFLGFSRHQSFNWKQRSMH